MPMPFTLHEAYSPQQSLHNGSNGPSLQVKDSTIFPRAVRDEPRVMRSGCREDLTHPGLVVGHVARFCDLIAIAGGDRCRKEAGRDRGAFFQSFGESLIDCENKGGGGINDLRGNALRMRHETSHH